MHSAQTIRAAAGALLLVTPSVALAQGDLIGRVMTEGLKAPVAGADIRFPRAGRAVTSDSAGKFQLIDLPSGAQFMIIRAVGFRPESLDVIIPPGQALVRDFAVVRQAQVIPEVRVNERARPTTLALTGFDDRRRQGIGTFFDRDQLAKIENRSMSVIMAAVPGLAVMHGSGSYAWAYSTRSVMTGKGAFSGSPTICDGLDGPDCIMHGARPHCYMDVYLDGAIVYRHDSPSPQPLYNLNSIPAEQIEGIEVFTSAAQIPAQYNRTGSGCGVILIWMRR